MRRRRPSWRSTSPACWPCSAPARPFTGCAGPRRRGGACGGPTTARSSSASPGRAPRWPGWPCAGGPRCSCSPWSGPARRPGIALRQVFLDAPQWVVAIPYVRGGLVPHHRGARSWCAAWAGPASSLMLVGRVVLHGRGAGLRRQAAGPVAACLRLPRGVPRLHAGRRGAVRLSRRLHCAAPLLGDAARALSRALLRPLRAVAMPESRDEASVCGDATIGRASRGAAATIGRRRASRDFRPAKTPAASRPGTRLRRPLLR